MDVIPSEIFRGHLDTIILLSLVNEDKHTNQIRDEIEERSDGKFELKQGTFYSCLQRIVKQGYVTEYRATSPDDGVRRKFYQLTEKGKSYIDDNKDKWEISRSVVNILLETPEKPKIKAEEKKKAPEKSEPVQEAFDIDKALKDFLSSDDTKTQQTPAIDENQNKSTEATVISDENVKIISFSDITAKTEQQNAKTQTTEAPSNVEPHDKPTPTKKQTDAYRSRQADSPELYDLFTLIGFDDGVNGKDNSQKEEVRVEPAKETTDVKEKVTEISIETDKNDAKNDEATVTSSTTTETKESSVEDTHNDNIEHNIFEFKPENEEKTSISATVYNEDEDDFYNGETTVSHDYRSVLQKIFHQQNKKQPVDEKPREVVYVQGTDIKSYFTDDNVDDKRNYEDKDAQPKSENQYRQQIPQPRQPKKAEPKPQEPSKTEPKREPEVSIVKTDGYDFSDIQSLAKMEGFKVNVSSGIIKKKVNSILLNKLIAVSSLIFYAFVLIEVALLAYFTSGAAKLDKTPYIVFAGIVGLFPLSALITYFVYPKRKVASISTLKSVIELCIVIMLNLVLITIVFCILAEVDFSNTAQLLRYVLYPTVVILNVPVYFIIKYLNLDNPRFFE